MAHCEKNQTKEGITTYEGVITRSFRWTKDEIDGIMKHAKKKARKEAIDWANANGCPDGCRVSIKGKVETSFVDGIAYRREGERQYLQVQVEWNIDWDCLAPGEYSRRTNFHCMWDSPNDDVEIVLKPGRYVISTIPDEEEERTETEDTIVIM